jgi:hypothetical protein
MRGFCEERGQATRLVFDRKTGTFGHFPIEHSFAAHQPASVQDARTRSDRPARSQVAKPPAAEKPVKPTAPMSSRPVRPAYAAPQPRPAPPAGRMSSTA